MSPPKPTAPAPGGSAEDHDLLAVLRMIAERAGKIVLRHYVDAETKARTKADASPVTDADEETEAFLIEALEAMTPTIPIVAEERAAAEGLPAEAGSRFWLVDPLDGTKEFLSRNGEFTVNVALIDGGRPIAGVVHAPAMAMTWAGAGPGSATFSETDQPPMGIATREIPAEGAAVVASRRHGDDAEMDEFLRNYRIAQKVHAGSSIKFCLLANGRADLYPRFGRTMEWDTAAGHAVLLAAGGRVETLEGRALTYGKPGFDNPYFIAYGK